MAAEGGQRLGPRGILHTLGDDHGTQSRADRQERPAQGGCAYPVRLDRGDRRVELHHVDRQRVQLGKSVEAGAEVVEREPDAAVA